MKNNMLSSAILQELLLRQLSTWEFVKRNYSILDENKTSELVVNSFEIKIQINAERIRSAVASIDKAVIKKRKCFLCENNRPQEQMFINDRDYQILVNPYPIFSEHFTIPSSLHTDQHIENRIIDMLNYSLFFKNHIVFYNGPKSGASAPDHFHFQVGNKGFLPLEKNDKLSHEKRKYVIFNKRIKIYTIDNYPANCIFIESADIYIAKEYFLKIYNRLSLEQPNENEPMLNLISWIDDGLYKLVIFPRTRHRPTYYYEDDNSRLLISPGAVEMGGVFILAIKEDYERITSEIISDIYNQVCISKTQLKQILENL